MSLQPNILSPTLPGVNQIIPNTPTLSLSRVLFRPVLRRLHKFLLIVFELPCDPGLDGIVRLRLAQQRPGEDEHAFNLLRGLPFVRAQHAQAHGPFVVIRHVGVVYLGLEAQGRRFEGVVCRQREIQGEDAALLQCVCALPSNMWIVRAPKVSIRFGSSFWG